MYLIVEYKNTEYEVQCWYGVTQDVDGLRRFIEPRFKDRAVSIEYYNEMDATVTLLDAKGRPVERYFGLEDTTEY